VAPQLQFMLLITMHEVMHASGPMDPHAAHYLIKPCTPQVSRLGFPMDA
jgi:hypothetical protein